MSLLEKLTATEKRAMKEYIEKYAGVNEEPVEMQTSIEEILRFWNKNKEDLFHMFGDELILEREVSVPVGLESLAAQITKACEEDSSPARTFYDDFMDVFLCYHPESLAKKLNIPLEAAKEILEAKNSSSSYWKFDHMIDSETLAKNIWDEEDFSLYNPKKPEKPIKIQKGTRILRALSKIASAYNLDGFEDFRLKHSQILNQKSLAGTLCLSIHPLDYMTMSDNDCNWHSCMSWKRHGCYRQGTVEMMNSNCVVVAYLKSKDHQMDLLDDKKYKWNSKKWRELFVIAQDEGFITEVKPYPYRNDALTKIVLLWLKEIFSQRYEYEDTIRTFGSGYSTYKDICIEMETDQMYNDFESGQQLIYTKDFGERNEYDNIVVNYSGESECMVSGTSGDECDFDTEEDLICVDYSGITRCEHCGDRILPGEGFEHDGEMYCGWCYRTFMKRDFTTGELEPYDELNEVYIMTPGEAKLGKNYSDVIIYLNDHDLEQAVKGDHPMFDGRVIIKAVDCYYTTDEVYSILSTQLNEKGREQYKELFALGEDLPSGLFPEE